MRTRYITKDGIEVKVDKYCTGENPSVPTEWGDRTSYYAGLVGGIYGGFLFEETIVHKVWLVSHETESRSRDGRELVLMWRSRKLQEKKHSLSSMMTNFKDPIQAMAEKVCEAVNNEDQNLEEIIEIAIGKVNFNELASDWWW
jgi:hypothetical protein